MYGAELSNLTVPETSKLLSGISLNGLNEQKRFLRISKELATESLNLFNCIYRKLKADKTDMNTDRISVEFDNNTLYSMKNLHDIALDLIDILEETHLTGSADTLKSKALYELEQIKNQAEMFFGHKKLESVDI
jgi:hypothetical protein